MQPTTDEQEGLMQAATLPIHLIIMCLQIQTKSCSKLIEELSAQQEISFDTETTGTDPNIAELVGYKLFL